MSTAVERVMRERGDLTVLHEPFMYDYYLGHPDRGFDGFAPDPDHPVTHAEICRMIRDRAETRPVFFKDMAYYVVEKFRQDSWFAREATHAFLVRDPAESVLSYARRQRDFTCEEVGIEAQWSLYQLLCELGHEPVILKAEAVRRDPVSEMARYWAAIGLPDTPDALQWDRPAPKAWQTVSHWHQEAMQTDRILPPAEDRDLDLELAVLGEPYVSFVAHHRPFYDRLAALAETG